MIFYTITDSMPVKPDWGSISGSLKAGTPISVKGAISNDDGAVGLVAADTAHGAEAVLVVTAGVVDLAEASASYGSAISDDVVKALDNVAFIYGGKVYGVAESSLPAVTAEDNGDVLTVVDGAWAKAAGGGGAFGFPCYVAKFVPNEDVTVGEDHYKGYDIRHHVIYGTRNIKRCKEIKSRVNIRKRPEKSEQKCSKTDIYRLPLTEDHDRKGKESESGNSDLELPLTDTGSDIYNTSYTGKHSRQKNSRKSHLEYIDTDTGCSLRMFSACHKS